MKPIILPDLRYRQVWLSLGLIMAAAVTVVCLLPAGNLPSVGMWDKFEHLLAFGSVAFWFGSIMVRRDLLWVALAVVGFGGLIEIAQGAMGLGRQAEWNDLLADAIGVLCGALLVLTPLGNWPRWIEARVARARA